MLNHHVVGNAVGVSIGQHGLKVVAHRDIHLPILHYGLRFDEDDQPVVFARIFAAHTPLVTDLVGEVAGTHAIQTVDRDHANHVAGGIVERYEAIFQLDHLLFRHQVGEVVDQARRIRSGWNLCQSQHSTPPQC